MNEVQDDLIERRFVGAHGNRRLARGHTDRDLVEHQPPQHRLHAGDDRHHVDRGRTRALRAAEREQLLGERGAAIGGAPDGVGLGPFRIVRLEHDRQQIGRAENGRQHVVEIVRHAAREAADGVHLLGLPQLILEREACGDVARNRLHADRACRPPRRSVRSARARSRVPSFATAGNSKYVERKVLAPLTVVEFRGALLIVLADERQEVTAEQFLLGVFHQPSCRSD